MSGDGRPMKALGAMSWRALGAECQHEAKEVKALLSVKEVAKLFGVHYKTVYQWRYQGKLRCVQVGTRVMFDPDDITRQLASWKED